MKPPEPITREEAKKLLSKPKRKQSVSQRIAAKNKKRIVSKAKAGRV